MKRIMALLMVSFLFTPVAQLAREAGLLPPLPEEKGLSKEELRAQKDRERTEAAKKRSHVVYKLPPGTVFTKDPLRATKKVVVTLPEPEKPEPRSKSEHNGKTT